MTELEELKAKLAAAEAERDSARKRVDKVESMLEDASMDLGEAKALLARRPHLMVTAKNHIVNGSTDLDIHQSSFCAEHGGACAK